MYALLRDGYYSNVQQYNKGFVDYIFPNIEGYNKEVSGAQNGINYLAGIQGYFLDVEQYNKGFVDYIYDIEGYQKDVINIDTGILDYILDYISLDIIVEQERGWGFNWELISTLWETIDNNWEQ